MATPPVQAADAVRKADVVDLTSKMRADGTLDWTPPAGNWVVLRIGYSLTGAQNRPASPEATGLEVDKLNKGYVKAYFDNYLDQYKNATGGLMGKRGLQYIIMDSWEAGVANWTNDMIAEFAKRRGYDMKPWLPALTGRIVESAEATDRFLWDFRKTLTEMTAEYHYDQVTDLLAARDMARYTESHESGRAFIADGMEVKAKAAIPMSAMWTSQGNRQSSQFDADVRESASVAHIYGQNLVAAESLTAGGGAWSYSPETLKPTADRLLSTGLNRFVIHTSVHQPVNDKIPGLGLGPFGQWFTRHETWAEQAKSWTDYLARSSYMLQQGKFVADIAYYYGEDSNITALFQNNPPPIPAGYNFDYVNSDVVKNRLTVAPSGALTTATGMSYRVLALDPNSQYMPLAVLRKIRDLVNAGAVVVGSKPIASPSLSDDAAEFKAIADQLWGGTTGKGKVFGTGTIGDALAALKVTPDFTYTKPQADTELAFVHRTLADGDVYWVSHRNARASDVEATFRVQGKAPELWHADTGTVEPVSYTTANGRHHRAAEPAAERRRVRGVPEAGHGPVAHHRQAGGDEALDRRGLLGRGVPAEPRRARQGDAARAGVVAPARRSRREVLLRHRHLHQDHPGAGGVVPGRREALPRSGRREEHRRGDGEREASRHVLEDAVPRGRDLGAQAGREHARDQGDQPVGQPADRRPAGGRHDEVHLHGAAVLPRRFAAPAIRADRARAGHQVSQQVAPSGAAPRRGPFLVSRNVAT